MDSSGLENLWIKSGVFGEGECEQGMKGKWWNHAICKLPLKALRSVLFACLTPCSEDNDKLIREDWKLQLEVFHMHSSTKMTKESVPHSVCQKLKRCKYCLMSLKFLVQRMPPFAAGEATWVVLTSTFTHLRREGDLEQFRISFAEMLPWFGALDNFYYSRLPLLTLSSVLCACCPQLHRRYTNALSLKILPQKKQNC